MQSNSQSSQAAVVLLSDYTLIYNEYQNALNEITRLKNSLRQKEEIISNQQQIIQRYQMIIFQQQISSANRPLVQNPGTQPQPTFGFPPITAPQKPVIDLTLENAGMCIVNRPTLFNPPQVSEKKTETEPKSIFTPFQFVTPQKNSVAPIPDAPKKNSNKRPIRAGAGDPETDGDETETDDELVFRTGSHTRTKTGKKFIKLNEVDETERSNLQKILVDINTEDEELLLHNKISVSIPTRNELEDMAFGYAKKCFLNKNPVKVNFSFVAETELLDKIWYLNINGHRFLRINNDFRDTNITKFMNNEVEVSDELKIVDGVDLIEVKCINNKWKQGITYSGMVKLLWFLANNHSQTCDKLLAKFASTLEKIVYSCEK